ncbi:MAG: hypothetical protein JST30_07530 [Armatimonadetes bacterium]|nr:hypothetical protein [Armatimonadota bacterium]
MRTNTLIVVSLGVLTLAGVAVAQDQGVQAIVGDVFLQSTTPGTSQVGHATITGTLRAGQVFVQQGSQTTIPVVGNNIAASGSTFGGSFSSASPNGTALRATATAMTGPATGIVGESRSDNGTGIHAKATNGIGLLSSVTQGVAVSATSQGGNAVVGISTSAIGVLGLNGSTTIASVIGANSATTGDAPGGSFTTGSTGGFALQGLATKTTGFSKGVVGESRSTINGEGVLGIVPNSGAGFGVHGKCLSPNGFGVFCEGNQAATGTKSFIIDHPLDPENRYLKHYCAEGPEPRNVYTGHVRTDGQGYAWVKLPDYYESVNTDPEYQLTVVDSSEDFVLVKVVQRVVAGRFRIRTSKPGVDVSWRIEAVRNDKWVRQTGHSAEPLKPDVYRGTYLNPELYGQPASRAQSRAGLRANGGGRP